VIADVRDEMRIAQEEIFGPAISAIPFPDIGLSVVTQKKQRSSILFLPHSATSPAVSHVAFYIFCDAVF
jgi:hypothetical protein